MSDRISAHEQSRPPADKNVSRFSLSLPRNAPTGKCDSDGATALSSAFRFRLDGNLHLTIRPATLESASAVP